MVPQTGTGVTGTGGTWTPGITKAYERKIRDVSKTSGMLPCTVWYLVNKMEPKPHLLSSTVVEWEGVVTLGPIPVAETAA